MGPLRPVPHRVLLSCLSTSALSLTDHFIFCGLVLSFFVFRCSCPYSDALCPFLVRVTRSSISFPFLRIVPAFLLLDFVRSLLVLRLPFPFGLFFKGCSVCVPGPGCFGVSAPFLWWSASPRLFGGLGRPGMTRDVIF